MRQGVWDEGRYRLENADELDRKNDRLIYENDRLKAALVKYGAHTDINCCYGLNPNEGYVCRCGLYDVIDAEAHLAGLG